MHHAFEFEGREIAVQLWKTGTGYCLRHADHAVAVGLEAGGGDAGRLEVGGVAVPVCIVSHGDAVHVHLDGEAYLLRYRHPLDRLAAQSEGARDDSVRAPMPGAVVEVLVSAAEQVSRGQALLVMESMKMQTTITAPRDGVIKAVHHENAQTFERDAVLVSLEAQA